MLASKVQYCFFFLIGLSLQVGDEASQLFYWPIMYGTIALLVVIMYFILGSMYQLDSEKDPLIYSKFLSVRKNR